MDNYYRCEKCEKLFYDQFQYIHHINRKRSCIRNKLCKICKKKIPYTQFDNHKELCINDIILKLNKMKNIINDKKIKLNKIVNDIYKYHVNKVIIWIIIYDITHRYLKYQDKILINEFEDYINFDYLYDELNNDRIYDKMYFFLYFKYYNKLRDYEKKFYHKNIKYFDVFYNEQNIKSEFMLLVKNDIINIDLITSNNEFKNYEKKLLKIYIDDYYELIKKTTYINDIKYDYDKKRYYELFDLLDKYDNKINKLIKAIKSSNIIEILENEIIIMKNTFNSIYDEIPDDEYELYSSFLSDNIDKSKIMDYINESKYDRKYDFIYDNNIIYFNTNIIIDNNLRYDLYMIHKKNNIINEILVIFDDNISDNLDNMCKDYYGYFKGINIIRVKNIKYLEKLLKKIKFDNIPLIKYYHTENIIMKVSSEINKCNEKINKIIKYNNNKINEKEKLEKEMMAIIKEYSK
jgi:hypothetical protein